MYRSQKIEMRGSTLIQIPGTKTIYPVSPNFVCAPTSSDRVHNFRLPSSADPQHCFEVAMATIVPDAHFPSRSLRVSIHNVVLVYSAVDGWKTYFEMQDIRRKT